MSIQIAGNCDERGTVEYNLALGERRAHAAQNYLTGLGVTEARLSSISYGKEKPKVQSHDEESWLINRNCQFTLQ
jgi:peptidoglycan-associated lipoprotein